MEELRNFLRDTVAEQSLFIAARLKAALPAIINGQPAERQRELTEKFIALYTTDAGLYALIDYVNFKGEGIALSERYQGVGWGLAQVLEQMDMATAPSPVEAFAAGAATVLTRRVELAPSERNEQRWLPGWLKRINSYRR